MNSEIAITTIQGPMEGFSKHEDLPHLSFEVKYRHSTNFKSFESFVSELVLKLLRRYVLIEIDKYKTMLVQISSNSTNLSLICNSVLVACLDGGIPLRKMFYSVGSTSLLVWEEEDTVVLRHTPTEITELGLAQAKKEFLYIKESIEYAMRDMFSLDIAKPCLP